MPKYIRIVADKKEAKIKIEPDTANSNFTRTRCPNCGSRSVVRVINGNIWVLFDAGTQNLHNCTGASNPWDNYEG